LNGNAQALPGDQRLLVLEVGVRGIPENRDT
jgi:hypothetical protein